MRRVDLSEELLLTASGVTRLLDGLEAAGYVDRAACSSDRRVVYAVITEPGRDKLEEAAESHFAEVRRSSRSASTPTSSNSSPTCSGGCRAPRTPSAKTATSARLIVRRQTTPFASR